MHEELLQSRYLHGTRYMIVEFVILITVKIAMDEEIMHLDFMKHISSFIA